MYYSTSIHKDGTKEIALTDAFSVKEIVKAMGFIVTVIPKIVIVFAIIKLPF